jgi:hypothetical protein
MKDEAGIDANISELTLDEVKQIVLTRSLRGAAATLP